MTGSREVISNIIFYALSIAVISIPVVFVFCLYKIVMARANGKSLSRASRIFSVVMASILVLEISCVIDAIYIEPNYLDVTQITLKNHKITRKGTRIRICQISDLHFAEEVPLVSRTIRTINQLKPDFVILTGDYLSDPAKTENLSRFIRALKPRVATYAVTGNWDVNFDAPKLFHRAGIPLLDKDLWFDRIGDTQIVFAGLYGRNNQMVFASSALRDAVKIVLGHNPDDVYRIRSWHVDYYFSGHTHGGQFRLPFWGPIETVSEFGKRYDIGPYKVGKTWMYVNRGLIFEKAFSLKIRFLCRPEITVVDLVPDSRPNSR